MSFRFAPGCCCRNLIGFEYNQIFEVVQCIDEQFPDQYAYVSNMYQDLSRLGECVAVFAGPSFACGAGIEFSPAEFGTIGDWVRSGGRLFVGGEYLGCANEGNLNTINAFYSGIGSSLSIGDNWGCDGGGCLPIKLGNVVSGAPIMEGVAGIAHAATNSISGGTPLVTINSVSTAPECIGVADYPYVAIEQLGEGYVVGCGDSNVTGGCSFGPYNCQFFANFISKETLL